MLSVRFLLENGADIHLAAGKYGLPLQSVCAVESPYRSPIPYHVVLTGTIKFFLRYKPPVHVKAHSGIFGSALQTAAYSGLAELISPFLDREAHIVCHKWCGKYGYALNAAVIKAPGIL